MAGASLCLAPAQADVREGTRCPTGEACVIVHVEDGKDDAQPTTFVVDAATIAAEADQIDKSYSIRSGDGSTITEQGSGLSINKIIGLVGVTPDSVTFSQAVRRDGQRSELAQGDFGPSDESAFQDGLVPIVKVEGARDAILYLRPQRSSSDVNAPDYFQTESQSALDLYVHTDGLPLQPVLSATPANQRTSNSPVAFTASGDLTGGGLTFDWTFGDGRHRRTTTPTTTYQYERTTSSGQDSFEAYVEVNAEDTSSGRSNLVRVAIGTPKPSGTKTPGTGSTDDPDGPATGPDTSQGDTSGASPSTTPGGTGASGGATAPRAPASGEVLEAAPGRVVADGLVQVSGILLGRVDAAGQVVPAPASARSLALAAAAARSGSDPSTRPDLRGVLAGVLGLALLLGLGAAGELRR